MIRALSICVVLGATSCQVIATPNLVGFRCNEGGTCDDGMTCCPDGYCRADCSTSGAGGGAGGGTASCTADLPCTGNPAAPCTLGRTSCINNVSECHDAEAGPDGADCGGGNVCGAGVCIPCMNGDSCFGNPDKCLQGALQCGSGTSTCVNDTKPRPPGSSCGTDQVCSPTGTCVACKQDEACTTNANICKQGRTECGSGAPTCLDGADKAAGAGCGQNLVCDGAGACITCMDGANCTTNSDPCKRGTLTCTGGAPGCTNGAARNVGDTCGVDKVCDSTGACVTCAAMQSCTTNPPGCKQGITSCASGASACVDSAANKSPGSSCGTNQVCNSAGTCVACTAGGTCTGNPNVCKLGTTQCGTGAPVCADSALNAGNGTPCNGGAMSCMGGVCGTCVPGSACTGNPTACKVGVQDCNGASPACNDGTGNRNPGTSCGTNLVCSTIGTCVACTAGNSCTTNSNACKQGVTSCTTGAQTCENGADLGLGTGCTGGFCSSGTCVACAIGTACTTNPTVCKTGVFARSGTQCVCNDDQNRGIGQVTGCLGTNTCNGAGVCTACTQGCALANVCQNGAVSCTTLQCAFSSNKGAGQVTGCNGNTTCNGNGSCVACNQACAAPECHTAHVSCANPASCVDDGAIADGSGCSGGSCGGGTCCTNCREGNTCYGGGNVAHCGKSGANCQDCSGTTYGACQYTSNCDTTGDRVANVGVCTGQMACGTNSNTVIDDPFCNRAAACTGGRCYGDVCCTGCWDGTSCRTGNALSACGQGGVTCDVCPSIPSCIPGLRGWQCLAGTCETCA